MRLVRVAELMAKILANSDDLRIEWPFAVLLEEGKTQLIVDGTMDLAVSGHGWLLAHHRL